MLMSRYNPSPAEHEEATKGVKVKNVKGRHDIERNSDKNYFILWDVNI